MYQVGARKEKGYFGAGGHTWACGRYSQPYLPMGRNDAASGYNAVVTWRAIGYRLQ